MLVGKGHERAGSDEDLQPGAIGLPAIEPLPVIMSPTSPMKMGRPRALLAVNADADVGAIATPLDITASSDPVCFSSLQYTLFQLGCNACSHLTPQTFKHVSRFGGRVVLIAGTKSDVTSSETKLFLRPLFVTCARSKSRAGW